MKAKLTGNGEKVFYHDQPDEKSRGMAGKIRLAKRVGASARFIKYADYVTSK